MKRFYFASLAVLFACTSSFASEADSPDTQLLTSFLNGIDNIVAEYVQHTHDGNNSLLQTQKGRLSLTRPNKFKWESYAPYEQVLVSNGSTLWQYDPDLEQVTIQKLDNRLSSTPVLLLSGNSKDVSKEYDVYSEKLQDEYHFVLIPKRTDTLFDRLRLEFNPEKVLRRMVIKDEVGQKTVITLSGVKKLTNITPETYEFIVPEGTDIIKSQ
jgi:outer membrane lipoprotein carrier protein